MVGGIQNLMQEIFYEGKRKKRNYLRFENGDNSSKGDKQKSCV